MDNEDFARPTTSSELFQSNKYESNELTQKFLKGEISFAEYSNEWYGKDEDDVEDKPEEDELSSPLFLHPKEKGPSGRRRRTNRLSPALLGLMGEANLRFVRGDKDAAEKMCYEIIRQVPNASEPYQTLAQIYENDAEKSMQFSLLAAHLGSSDANEWLRLAAISQQRNDSKQAMICYTQAIKAEPQNLSIHLQRLDLLTALENINYPINNLKMNRLKCYFKIVTSLPASDGENIMHYAKLAASLYHKNEEIERALQVMNIAYQKCPNLFTVEDINLFLELLIHRKEYQLCIEVLVANVEVEIEAEIQTIEVNSQIEECTNYLNCKVPDNLPIDLKSKMLICFVHLHAFNLVESLIDDFLKNDVDKAGDLFMDIEEALSAVGQYKLALKVLEPLVQTKSFDLGAVWLKHAECLTHTGQDELAIKSYYKVLQHAPQHTQARKKIFELLEKCDRIDEALVVLNQDYNHVLNSELLYQQCSILKKLNMLDEYLEIGYIFLRKYFVKFRHSGELQYATYSKNYTGIIQNYRKSRGEKLFDDDDYQFSDNETFKISSQEIWELFKDLLHVAYSRKNYELMTKLAYGAIASKHLLNYSSEIQFYCLQACLLNKDPSNALPLIKEFVQKYNNMKTYNLLNLISQKADDNIGLKVYLRLFRKKYDVVKEMFLGNNYLLSGRYLAALKYHLDYHTQVRDPFSILLIAVDLLSLAAVRTVDKSHELLLQSLAYFLKYQHLRRCDQEAYFNIGKAFHSFSLFNLAIEYYEKALDCPPVVVCDIHGSIDLTREIAYNLCCIYKHSPRVSRKYMMKYLVI